MNFGSERTTFHCLLAVKYWGSSLNSLGLSFLIGKNEDDHTHFAGLFPG